MAIVKKKKNSNAPDIRRERRNILNEKTAFSIIEEYKLLRTNIMFSLAKDGCKKVAFTSANMSEGKSISAINTSITFAEMNQKVLLIDCDPKFTQFITFPKQEEGVYYLKDVVSRKKQLIPLITEQVLNYSV